MTEAAKGKVVDVLQNLDLIGYEELSEFLPEFLSKEELKGFRH